MAGGELEHVQWSGKCVFVCEIGAMGDWMGREAHACRRKDLCDFSLSRLCLAGLLTSRSTERWAQFSLVDWSSCSRPSGHWMVLGGTRPETLGGQGSDGQALIMFLPY